MGINSRVGRNRTGVSHRECFSHVEVWINEFT
jgi:hypothetical protein